LNLETAIEPLRVNYLHPGAFNCGFQVYLAGPQTDWLIKEPLPFFSHLMLKALNITFLLVKVGLYKFGEYPKFI